VDISQIVLQEDITKGERIRSFIVEAWIQDRWIMLCEGSVIGHKFIRVFNKVNTGKVRLIIDEAIDTPQIKNFAVYNID